MNYFELYNIPVAFNVDKALVKKKYFELSKKFHPDFVSNGTEMEQLEALEISSIINKAFKIFNNEDELIKYVLILKEILQTDEKYELPNDFLMEMMELNEELMDAKMDENQLIIDNSKLSIVNYQASMKKEVEMILNTETLENIEEKDFLKVKEYYFKKKYLNRILDGIK